MTVRWPREGESEEEKGEIMKREKENGRAENVICFVGSKYFVGGAWRGLAGGYRKGRRRCCIFSSHLISSK